MGEIVWELIIWDLRKGRFKSNMRTPGPFLFLEFVRVDENIY